MKRLVLSIVLVIPFIFSSYLLMAENAPLEVYTPKIVIDAVLTHDSQLGALPGNFVIHYGVDWIGGVQPSDIEVDDEGYIYILDMGNDRIQKFNIDGQYVGSIPVKECYVVDYNDVPHPLHHYKKEFEIDKDGNFIILDTGSTKERGEEIIKIDKNGNELEKYGLSSLKTTNPEIFRDGIKEMKLDEKGMPYFESKYLDNKSRELKTKNIVRIEKGNTKDEKVVIKSDFNIKTDSKGREYEIQGLKENERIIKRIVNGKPVGQFNLKTDTKISGMKILGADVNGNVFVRVSGHSGIYKYNKNGDLQARIANTWEYWTNDTMSLKINVEESEFIDDNGNFYLARLLEKENKLQVIRWSK